MDNVQSEDQLGALGLCVGGGCPMVRLYVSARATRTGPAGVGREWKLELGYSALQGTKGVIWNQFVSSTQY